LSDRKDSSEELCEYPERDQPHANQREQVATPPFDGRSARADPIGYVFVRQGHKKCSSEREQDDDGRRHRVCGERGPESSGRKRLPRQTGEDGPRSTEANDQVGKPEHGETRNWMVPPEPRLPLQERLG
jgi:hypothetical protein